MVDSSIQQQCKSLNPIYNEVKILSLVIVRINLVTILFHQVLYDLANLISFYHFQHPPSKSSSAQQLLKSQVSQHFTTLSGAPSRQCLTFPNHHQQFLLILSTMLVAHNFIQRTCFQILSFNVFPHLSEDLATPIFLI